MADTSDVQLAFANDALPNAALPNALAWFPFNFVSHDLSPQSESVQSKAIRPDAALKEVRRTSSSSAGTIAVELSRDPELDVLLAYALRGAWVSNILKAGVARNLLVFEEKVLEDVAPSYTRYRGCLINGFSLSASTDGMVDVTFPIQGQAIEDAVVVTTGATYAQPGNEAVLAGVDFTGLTDSGLTTQLDVASVSFDMTNNGRSDQKLGQAAPRSVSWGKRVTTITASLFFTSHEAFQQFKADPVRAIAFGFKDPGSPKSIAFSWPRCRATSFGKPIPGENQTIMVAVEFTATYDGTSATDFRITRSF